MPEPPERPPHGHKGTFGTVLVIGGSRGMIGAPALVGRAAFRAGVGLVKLIAPDDVLHAALSVEPSATGLGIQGWQTDEVIPALQEADPHGRAVLAVGPGMGHASGVPSLIGDLVRGKRPIVLDADGLNGLAAWSGLNAWIVDRDQAVTHRAGAPDSEASPSVRVFTPHPGEYRRLAAAVGLDHDPVTPSARPRAASDLATTLGGVVVLKGQQTVVSDGSQTYQNPTGNPALATAGSGDVLTGVIAALLAQGMPPFNAAVLAVWTHGQAADHWAAQHGTAGLLARELADAIGPVLWSSA